MMRRWWWVPVSLLVAADVWARVGGGESYSGGSSSGGSSSGGSSGDGGGGLELVYYLVRFLFWLTINHPLIGIPVDIVVIVIGVRWFRSRGNMKGLSVSSVGQAAAPAVRLETLRRFDPNFSEITFSDFCYSLYARAHDARGRGKLDQYAPYLSASARETLRRVGPQGLREVRGVVIGSFRILSVGGLDTDTLNVTIAVESNYTEVTDAGPQSWYVDERWVLERRRDILSPPPEKAKADHCPRCGAALSTRTDGSCDYCGVKIENGSFQWYVRAITQVKRETRGPLLTSNVPEQGTSRPTVWQPHILEHRRALEAAHGGFDWDAFRRRVQQVAVELQDAWTARDWERVRPLETDGLFQMHRYWIDAYRKQKLTNIVADFRVTEIEIAKVTTDAFYEAITVRIHAQGRDHTLDESGKVVAGSKTQLRTWTEYWTFIRSRAGHGETKVSCPNCGAKLAAGATGVCEFCGGKLTRGSFDWVLSRIEQDESYS